MRLTRRAFLAAIAAIAAIPRLISAKVRDTPLPLCWGNVSDDDSIVPQPALYTIVAATSLPRGRHGYKLRSDDGVLVTLNTNLHLGELGDELRWMPDDATVWMAPPCSPL